MNQFNGQLFKQYIGFFIALLLALVLGATPPLASGKVFFYHNDATGTPMAMTDESGSVVWEADYLPFGQESELTGSVQNKNRFVGKEKDEETGLSYFGARYLDDRSGRFTKVDPVGISESDLMNPQRFNRYAYGLNNPYKYVDPDGEFAILGTLAIAYAVSEVASTAYDAYGAGTTLANPNATTIDKGIAVGALVGGILAPGPGAAYKQGSKAGKALWTSTKKKSAVENAFGHYKKHKSEFPEFQNAKQYVEGTKKFLNSPPKGTLAKTHSNGNTLLYNPKSNTFGVKDANGVPRTMFRPKNAADYWNSQ